MNIFDASLGTLENALNLRMRNQQVIAANLANVDTPGYQAQRMDFEASMAQALQGQTDPAVIAPSGEAAHGLDGNNVDMEGELSRLSANKTLYSVTAQIVASKLRQMHTLLEQEP